MDIPSTSTDLILHNGTVTTLDRSNPSATAVAIRDGKFLRVGTEADVMPLAGAATRVIDLEGRRVLPGLIDNHLHIIRAGLSFNMELRWDGVRSLADAMDMIADRVIETRRTGWEHRDAQGHLLRRCMSIAHLGGATLDNEENYLIKKLFTAGLGMVCISNQARI